jgi:glycosyltransferase involved in cell wall biosynthesis
MKKKIIMIAPTAFFSGRGTSYRVLSSWRTLLSLEYNTIVYTYPFGKENGVQHVTRIRNIFFWIQNLPSGFHWYRIVLDFSLFFRILWDTLKEKKEVVFYAHLHEGVLIVWLVSKILFWRDIKIIGDFHGSLSREVHSRYSFVHAFLQKVELWIYRMPDICAASSLELAAYIQDVVHRNVVFLPDVPSVSFREFSRDDILKTYDIPQHKKIVLYTGGFSKDKNIALLWNLMRDTPENIFWIIAGGGYSMLDIPEFISNNMCKIITPLDHDTLCRLLFVADIFIEPKDGYVLQGSGKIVNALVYGLPILTRTSDTHLWYTDNRFPLGLSVDTMHQLLSIDRKDLLIYGQRRVVEIEQGHTRVISDILQSI